jgi:spore germination protein GerM
MKKVLLVILSLVLVIVLFGKFSTEKVHDDDKAVEEKPVSPARTVKLFYHNEKADKDVTCNEEYVLPLEVDLPNPATPIKSSIELLLSRGLTAEEKAAGFNSEFPNEGFKLLSANLSSGTLTLLFSEVPGFTSGGSCRVGILRSQIMKTAKQFPEVKEVIIQPESIFQP